MNNAERKQACRCRRLLRVGGKWPPRLVTDATIAGRLLTEERLGSLAGLKVPAPPAAS
jgi:hypothetical protein